MIDQLKEQIKVVAGARERLKEATEWRASAYQKWVEANQPLLDNENNEKGLCQEAEAGLRELTLEAYAQTGDKKPIEGVGIREVTKLEYDSQTAYDWAVAHTMAIKLDVSAFEKIAKASPPDFVRVYLEPQATIATELKEENYAI